MLHKPRSIDLTHVSEWQDGAVRRFQDYLVAEEPMEIRIGETPLTVTMRTPGNDFELAIGFLFTEGLITGREQVESIEHGRAGRDEVSGNIIVVKLTGAKFERERMQRNFFTASSCGICGKASIDSVRVRGIKSVESTLRLEPDVLCSLPDKLRGSQTIFGRTGGLHAAALFTPTGELLVLREDVGRHNAVDKIIGWALSRGHVPLHQYVLLVSGRGGFEIVQKAAVAGLPLVASVSAPSGLAVRLAREMDMTLVGFLRGRRFLVYSGEERLRLLPDIAPVA